MEYEPIQHLPGGNHIRVLNLAPSANLSDPIHVKLSVVKLADEPTFIALSYVWGSDVGKLPITCNGEQFLVTQNLDSALRHLRDEGKERILWIDAICINQNDDQERGFQVNLMKDIYRMAHAVVIWLGEADADSDLVFPLCEKMTESRLDLLKDLESGLDVVMGPNRKQILEKMMRDAKKRNAEKEREAANLESEVDVSDASDEEISAFMRLIARPWFSRCWILQEVCLAKQAVLLCGTQAIDWDIFYIGFVITVLMSEKGLRGRPEQLFRTALVLIGRLRTKIHDEHSPYEGAGLLWLLSRVWSLSATNARDKVYAILGLLGEEESLELNIIPDYTQSVEECYQKTSLLIMSQMKNLDILHTDRIFESTLDLPSWVTDWRSLPDPSPICLDPHSHDIKGEEEDKRPFNASLSTQWTPKTSSDARILMLSGYDFDEIIEVEDILTVPAADHNDIAGMASSISNATSFMKRLILGLGSYFDILVKWEALATSKKYSKYPTGEDTETVFAMTMCTGSIDSPELALQRFQKWRKTLRGPRKVTFLKNIGINGGFYKTMVAAVGIGSGLSVVDDRVYATATEATLWRRLARTKKGYLAVIPSQTIVGDHVALYKGGRMPFIVRQREANKRELIGPCYVHGIMYGESWDEALCNDVGII
ncbi:HET-domain-containing protein [Trichoderma asperelloides]|nr:HET-domain-containing protein [Trichoderma asperelloides]